MVQDPYVLRPSAENGIGDLSVWNFGAYIEDSHSLLPHPYLNYKVLAIGAGGMAQIQAYPAKSTYLIRQGFDAEVFTAVINSQNPDSIYMLSVVDSVKLAFNKATISTEDYSLSFNY